MKKKTFDFCYLSLKDRFTMDLCQENCNFYDFGIIAASVWMYNSSFELCGTLDYDSDKNVYRNDSNFWRILIIDGWHF